MWKLFTFRVDHLQMVDGHLQNFGFFELSRSLLLEGAGDEPLEFGERRVYPVPPFLLYNSSALFPRQHLTTIGISWWRASRGSPRGYTRTRENRADLLFLRRLLGEHVVAVVALGQRSLDGPGHRRPGSIRGVRPGIPPVQRGVLGQLMIHNTHSRHLQEDGKRKRTRVGRRTSACATRGRMCLVLLIWRLS